MQNNDLLSNLAKSRDNNFNLIRFLAAFMVLISHSYFLMSGPGNSISLLQELVGKSWGAVGVDVFFVTSGFLIAGSFFRNDSVISFIWARVLRIFPALIISVLFCVFIIGPIFSELGFVEYMKSNEVLEFILRNCTLVFGVKRELPGVFSDLPVENVVNGSLWTLPYEIWMYILLGIFGFVTITISKLLKLDARGVLFALATLFVTSVLILNYSYPDFFISHIGLSLGSGDGFLRFLQLFFAGATFYVLKEKVKLKLEWCFLILILLVLLTVVNKSVFLLCYHITLAYIVLCVAYLPKGYILNFNKLGDYSYGIYIYAFPVQQAIVSVFQPQSIMTMIILSSFVTFIFAFASWNYIEKNALKLKGFLRVKKNKKPNPTNALEY
ncbi:acyltransferase family protein [Catenovulum sp. SX2]|uniref:acyltransferase family protein n=1 Tax=Catenovulum sp. SX2 TaxID=3398614 RepID=UPI003F858547